MERIAQLRGEFFAKHQRVPLADDMEWVELVQRELGKQVETGKQLLREEMLRSNERGAEVLRLRALLLSEQNKLAVATSALGRIADPRNVHIFGQDARVVAADALKNEAEKTGCEAPLEAGQWWGFCGQTDMGQSLPALCTECGGDMKRA